MCSKVCLLGQSGMSQFVECWRKMPKFQDLTPWMYNFHTFGIELTSNRMWCKRTDFLHTNTTIILPLICLMMSLLSFCRRLELWNSGSTAFRWQIQIENVYLYMNQYVAICFLYHVLIWYCCKHSIASFFGSLKRLLSDGLLIYSYDGYCY